MATPKGTTEKMVENPQEMTDAAIANLSQAQYNDQLETHQTLLQAKNAELSRLTEMLRSVRESKEPLTKVKAMLQAEINEANKAINAKSEEVTFLKQKLRYHSVKQIHENIERLEYQLRNNNYKPREEQKILDEISMLQRSTKTLREFEAKQAENKKYRAERARLIDERNSNYCKIRALYAQEDEIKKAMTELRGVISNSKKSVDQLRQMKPSLEKNWVANQPQQQAARSKRYEEKRRQRQEQFRPRDRQEARRKIWEKYEASREPYEEECDMCRVLITYLQSSMNLATPSSHVSSPCFPRLTPTTPSGTPSTPVSDPDYVGSFYMKPKDEDGFTRVSKRDKAKTKREQRLARRVKELPHTPDVLLKFNKLSISPPKNTDEIPAAVIALQDSLQHYHNLFLEAKQNNSKEKEKEKSKEAENVKWSRPTSLAINVPQLLVTYAEVSAKTSASPMVTSSTPLQSESISSTLDKSQSLESPNLPIGSNIASPPGQCLASPKLPLSSNIASPTGPSLGSPKLPLGSNVASPPGQSLGNPKLPLGSNIASPPGQCLGSPKIPLSSNVASPLGQFLGNPKLSLGSNIASPTGHCFGSPKLPLSSSVASPTMSWAAAVAANRYTNPEASAVLSKIPIVQDVSDQEIVCNGAHSPEVVNEVKQFNVPTISDKRDETKLCNGFLSLGNNDSFFSAPISYPNNLVEVNNNAVRSYANVTAKIKAAAVEF